MADTINVPVKPEDENKPAEPVVPGESTDDESEEVKKVKEEAEKEKAGLVAQIIELRKKNQDLEASKVETPKPAEVPGEDEVEKKIRLTLAKDRQIKQDENRKSALRKFWENHPEYNPENDLSGLRADVLMGTYNKLNRQGSETVEDFLNDFEFAFNVLNTMKASPKPKSVSPGASTTETPPQPKGSEPSKLTPEEEKLRQEKGWTVEKFLQMKAKYPSIFR